MALTFSYKIVQSNGASTSNNATDFGNVSGSTTGTTHTALSDNTVEIYGHGTDLDKSRQYWIEVYAQEDSTRSNRGYILEGLDLSLDFVEVDGKQLFESIDGASFQYASALDLFNSSTSVGTNGIRFTAGSADNFTSESTGIQLNNGTDNFLGRIQVDVNDTAFTTGYEDSNAVDFGDLSSYVSLTVDEDNTIVNTHNNGGNSVSIETLGQYLTTRASDTVGYTNAYATSSSTGLELTSGQISTSVTDAFDGFGTDIEVQGVSKRTNLVREGQTLTGSFDVTNVGEAGLTNLNMTGGVTATNNVLSFTTASVDNAVSGAGAAATNIVDAGSGNYTIGASLESGVRNNVTGDSEGTADTMTVNYQSVVGSGIAGSVSKVDFSALQMTANGETAQTVFSSGAVIENLVTYQADVSYDGKVGLMDLSVLNAAKADGVTTAADVDHNGSIDISDLQEMAQDWGKSLWLDESNGYQDADALGAKLEAQNTGLDTEQNWTNSAFDATGTSTNAAVTAGTIGQDATLYTEVPSDFANVGVDGNYS